MRVFATIFSVIVSVSVVAGAEPLAKGQFLPELRLKNGIVLHHVKIVAVDPGFIMANWDEGRGNIPAAVLPEEIRRALPKSAASGAARTDVKATGTKVGLERDPVKPPDPILLRGGVGDESGPVQTITG